MAIDGSEASVAALKQAADKAAADGAELVVLTVTTRDLGISSLSEEIAEYSREEHLAGGEAEGRRVLAEDILAGARKLVGARKRLKATYISRAGDPAEEILACARDRSADALYLGSRGRGALGALILGGVSRKVAAAAGCTVVIVPKER
ncbi:MAG TPA: universal stress protein [Stellaceae bacterium]|nr:universal stress protein [Stellaceae bacterium]